MGPTRPGPAVEPIDADRIARSLSRDARVSVDIVRDDWAVSSLWWATKNEWLGLLDVAGLEVEALYGSFQREPLTEASREYVFVTRHRQAG